MEVAESLCRNRVKQNCNLALLTIDGVVSRGEVDWYVGKRVCFPYKARTERKGTRHRAIWGKVRTPYDSVAHRDHKE